MQEQNPAPETAQPEVNEEQSQRAAILAILDGKTDESPQGETGGDADKNVEPQKEEVAPPRTIKEFAERHNLKVEDLYALEVAFGETDENGNAKALPLGKLKDIAAAQEKFNTRELEFEEKVAKRDAEWTRSQAEFAQLVAALGPNAVSPALREQVRQRVEREQAAERTKILETIPEWKDETTREQELSGMVEHLRDFGIPDTFLKGNLNHKLFRFVRDAYLRKQRVEKALATASKVKRPPPARSAGNQPAARSLAPKPEARKGTSRDRVLNILK